MIIHVENDSQKKNIETECELLAPYQNRQEKYKTNSDPSSMVVFYCPFNQTYTKIEKYTIDEILGLLSSYQSDNFFIIQVDNDVLLNEEIIKMQFKSEFHNIHKMFDLKLDYCFSPVDELLCFNMSILTNIFFDEVERFMIQIFFHKNGLYIINKDCCENILNIFISRFQFVEIDNEEFFQQAHAVSDNRMINNVNFCSIVKNQLQFNEKERKLVMNKLVRTRTCIKHDDSFSLAIKDNSGKIQESTDQYNTPEIESYGKKKKTDTIQSDNKCPKSRTGAWNAKLHKSPEEVSFERHPSEYASLQKDNLKQKLKKVDHFSTDDLIYWLLVLSLEKLEEFSQYLVNEAESLKGIYLELSENERKDFFRRIHSMEVSMQLIYQEILIKKKFLKYSKAQFSVYNKLSHNFYFKNSFNFFIELMISKVTYLEILIEKLQSTMEMIKENYSIIIEDNTEKQNVKLNTIMKVLAIITTIYAPFNIIPGLWGMNVKVPWRDEDSLWPFFGMIMVLCLILFIQLAFFKKLKWF